MLDINQYRYIQRVKNENVFTREQSVPEYVKEVRTRMARWYGLELGKITEQDVYEFLIIMEGKLPEK